ncbi:glycoside hydrolase family 3 protein [Paratractidigestivibacter faecalis]|uniref:Glycoside hydrolase family 3 protein n=1 Tax=Paratractidigestivibacter faecalis TaxID=2292441 RepID=A0ABV1IF04_9ACTN
MKLSMTRRGFVLGSASAAVLAGLAGCSTPGAPEAKKESVITANKPASEHEYYKSDYAYTKDDEKQLVADEAQAFAAAVGEGIVLLKNEAGALPLSPADGKVVAFGNATQYMTGFDAAMAAAGFDFDADAWDFYANGTKNVTRWEVNENPWATVTAAPFFSAASGTAIVFLGRRVGEGSDAQWYRDHDYLALSAEEKDMLNGVAELRRAGTFSKMIVCVTTSNNISWEDGPWSDAIDGILWFGNITSTGYSAPLMGSPVLVDVLAGKVNPSGRLADSIYKDNQAIPAMANFGHIDADLSQVSADVMEQVTADCDKWTPAQFYGDHWRHEYLYAEGIYVGYRYYETRYEDVILGQGNVGDFDYSKVVAYPFGSGMSYSTFEYSDFSVSEGADDFTVNVTVTNTGSVAGKHSALVYVQSPFTDYDRANGVEKASIELKGYEKTKLLDPGASEQLSIKVSKRELASYDAKNAKTYIVDDGDYYFTVAGSSHEALNNVLAAKGKTVADGMTAEGSDAFVWVWSNPDFDAESFSTSVIGAQITNVFDNVDPTLNEDIKDKNQGIVYLTRTDWEGTFPKEATRLVYTDALVKKASPIRYQAGSGDASNVAKHEFGKDSKVMLVDMYDKAYDDPDWEKLVSKMTYEEMVDFINDPAMTVEKIGKPKATAGNGSQGWGTTFCVSGLTGQQYCSKETTAATFNTEVHTAIGSLTGENLLHSSTNENKNVVLYGWSCDTHRTPYSGRNFEYFSEDPYLGGRSCAEETLASVNKGVVMCTKHCAGNDQEEYRHGVPSWANEQTLREIYLRQFEKAIVEGKSNGTMTGFNRLGMMWTGENKEFLKGFLEKELGYMGINLTDQFESSCMDAPDGLLAGSHAWLGSARIGKNDVCKGVLLQDDYKNDPVIQDALFEAIHRNLYNYANSLCINGMTSDYAFQGDNPICKAASTGAAAAFYGDKNFAAIQAGFFSTTRIVGTYELAEDGTLTLNVEDGDTITAKPDDKGLLTWEFPGGRQPIVNTISIYDMATAYNAAFGTKYATGDNPTFKVTFASGDPAATGSDPAAIEFHCGDSVKLPECPYQGENLVFAGWNAGRAALPAGADYATSTYADVELTATFTKKALATATTRDGYFFTTNQGEGIPMVLYADGTVELDRWKGYVFTGSWEVAGSGSGAGTLTVKNESGQAVAAKQDDSKLVYEQDGYQYDWNQPDQGFGSGVFLTPMTHTIDLDEFTKAYNEANGTSYSSMDVKSGAAAFASQESGEPKSTF